MHESYIILGAVLGSAFFTGFFTWASGRDSENINKANKVIVTLAEQVKACH